MKKIYFSIMIPLLGTFTAFSQAELTVTAPPAIGSTTGLRAPNGTAAHTTFRGVIIIPASELTSIPTGTTITKLSMLLSTGAIPGPAGGNIQYYLENTADVTNLKSTTWATAITGMTSVYNGAFSIPSVAGLTGNVTLTSPFVYTGGSVYVAYDYLGTVFTTTGAIYSANNSLAASWKGQPDPTTTPPATITQSSGFRPCFQFTFANPFTNELNVSGLAGEKGIFNNTIKTTQTVTSLITNTSVAAIANIPVTLTITGANPYSVTQTIPSIGSGATSTITFNNVPSVNLGAQSLTVTIPTDENPGNNTQTFTQLIQCDTISYAKSPVQSGGVGFNTGAGVIGVRHAIPNNIETFVKSVSNYFPIAPSNAGNTIKGLLLDGNGVILDSTNLITITAPMLGTKQNFDFLNGAIDVSGSVIYVGFRQTANTTTGYFPFANQDNSYVDPNAGATFPLFGGTPAPLGSGLGYMMIEATLTYGGFDVANTSTGGSICANTTLGILPTVGYSNYNFFVNGISVQNSATATYTTGPINSATNYNVDITNGSCLLNSNVDTITIVTALINNLSAAICPGGSFIVGSNIYTSPGFYSVLLTSSSGCDSTVNLTLSSLSNSSSTITGSICPGGTYAFGSQILTSAGNYMNIVPNAAGCDSAITLILTVNSTTSSTLNETVCANSYQFGTQNLTASGTYTNTIQNAAGCDSIITLNLTLNAPVSVTTSTSDITITATSTPGTVTYQWIDCVTNAPITGETSMTFTPTSNGNYAVVVQTPAGCSDTSACVNINSVKLDELNAASTIRVYPNPTTTELHAVSGSSNILEYTVFDASGRAIISHQVEKGTKEIDFSVQNLENGSYILELNTEFGTIAKPFVKK